MKKIEIVGLAMLSILFFVWPVPHMVSVRDLLLATNLLGFGYLAWRQGRPREVWHALSMPVVILLALTAWMYAVVFFVFPENTWSLGEIESQWWRALGATLAGTFAALAVREKPGLTRGLLAALLIALVVHIMYVDFQAVRGLFAPGPLDRMAGLTEGPDKSNYLTNILFGFLLADLFFRVAYRQRVLPLSRAAFAAVLALAAFSVIAERTRNGIITLVLMLLLLGWLYLRERRKRLNRLALSAGIAAMIAILIGGAALVVTARQSSSFDKLADTIAIAWDTEHYKAWQDNGPHGWPTLPDGTPVDDSVYLRIAWFKEGLLLVRDHPLGIGFGRNAFGHGLTAKYGKGTGHSHSGLLDMAIGLGIPGVLLWLGFFASLAVLAWRYGRARANYAAILLLLLLTDYGVRMVLDSVIRDHMLQQFLFLAGLAAVMTTAPGPEKRKVHT